VTNKVIRPASDKTGSTLGLLRAGCLNGGMGDNRGCRLARMGECILGVAKPHVEARQIVERCRHGRMVLSERVLKNAEPALMERLGFGVAALLLIKQSKIVQRQSEGGMIATESFLDNGQGSLQKRLGVRVASLIAVVQPEMVEGFSDLRMLRAEGAFENSQCALQ